MTAFHNTIYLQGPHEPHARLIRDRTGAISHAAVETSGASIFAHTRAEAEALARAFLAARDMLPEPEPPAVDPDCVAGKHTSCVGGPCECECHTQAAHRFEPADERGRHEAHAEDIALERDAP